MNPITGWLVAVAIAAITGGVIWSMAEKSKSDKAQRKVLEEEIEKQKEIVVEVYKHAEEVAKIKKDQSQINQKINEAKTDEEISNIISGILAANNDRVRK